MAYLNCAFIDDLRRLNCDEKWKKIRQLNLCLDIWCLGSVRFHLNDSSFLKKNRENFFSTKFYLQNEYQNIKFKNFLKNCKKKSS